MDPFFVLGLEPDATTEQIEERYLRCMREYPPDKAPEHFARFRQAYEQLREEEQRLFTQLRYFDITGRSLTEEFLEYPPKLQRKRLSQPQMRELILAHVQEIKHA